VEAVRPQVIVNAGAYTAVDRAEDDQPNAASLNALAPKNLAELAKAHGALLVHYSTDYVYDGSGQVPRREDAPPAPLSVYGRTKLEGDQHIAASGCEHLIFRTSWVYATRGHNFIKTMLRLGQEREVLSVIDDQWGAPTSAELIADVTAQAITATRGSDVPSGVYHLVAKGETSWHQYASYIFFVARELRPDLPLQVRDVKAIPTSAYPTPAVRPLNSRLDCSKLERTFELTLPDWRLGVRRTLTELLCP
ncbi:MAG: dTDP-4-dehydrorhamnose reductase, partial [Myxococcota bacterium]